MTTFVGTSSTTGQRPATPAPGAASWPQVNLLPPEVGAARGLRRLKQWLLVGVLLVVLACAGIYVLAVGQSASAQADLTTAQAETTRLQTEQQSYSDLTAVRRQLSEATQARTLAMAPDVRWTAYLDAIGAVLPAGASIDSFTVTETSPLTGATGTTSADPLQAPSLGQIAFTARSTTLPVAADWIDALNGVPGLADAWVSDSTLTSGDTGTYYAITATVQVNSSALSQRFTPTQGEG